MATNRKARKALEKEYGKECFIEKLNLRKGRILYTGQKRTDDMHKLTYHHIKMKKDDGESTPENGAILNVGNHVWFHKQTPDKQEEMNQAFQDYKACNVVFVDDIFPRANYKVVANHFSIKELKIDKELHDKTKQKEDLKRITREFIDR